MTWTITPRGYKTIVDMGAPNSAEFVGPNHAANAQLSAAAPGLLSALENLVVLFDRIDRSGATNKAAYNDAIAVIAKVKGA